jgi:hypothetical protein
MTLSQTELRESFYLSICPLISFQKTVEKDLNNIVEHKTSPSFGLEFGYFKPLNKNLTFDFGFCIKRYNSETYSTKFPPFKVNDRIGSLNLNFKLSNIFKLKDDVFLQNGLCLLLTYVSNITFTSKGGDSTLNVTRKTTTVWHNGLKPFIGISSGLYFKAKRTWYFGLTYYQGLNTYYTTETSYFYNGITGNSQVLSKASHLQLDLRINLKRNRNKE